ncbi:hypothetical protein EWM64_g1898 [Hericium alpestre]|uniref:Uncharacterized protein n=1 Tax=Hericium alpestre TaxID=135208 RepID=A0A4Z0A6X7_9AGAM|nr:hypothetical protein EWM64_g1898 [Hericium alpestre]
MIGRSESAFRCVLTIMAYSVLAIEFFVRAFREKPVREVYATLDQSKREAAAKKTPKLRLMMYGLLAMGLFIIIIRSVYGTIELSNGFKGKIVETEIWFNIFDGSMIVLAMYTLNFLHPGFLLRHDTAPLSPSPSEVSLTLANPHPPAEFEPEKPATYGWSGSGAV